MDGLAVGGVGTTDGAFVSLDGALVTTLVGAQVTVGVFVRVGAEEFLSFLDGDDALDLELTFVGLGLRVAADAFTFLDFFLAAIIQFRGGLHHGWGGMGCECMALVQYQETGMYVP